MPIKSEDLHGNVPDTAGAALLLIDVINDFEFENGERSEAGDACRQTNCQSKGGSQALGHSGGLRKRQLRQMAV